MQTMYVDFYNSTLKLITIDDQKFIVFLNEFEQHFSSLEIIILHHLITHLNGEALVVMKVQPGHIDKNHLGKSKVRKTSEGEMLIRTLPIILLQIFCKIMLNS